MLHPFFTPLRDCIPVFKSENRRTDMDHSFRSPPFSQSLEHWLTPKRFSIVLALLICAIFWKVICGLEAFVIRDFGFFSYPLAYYHRESLWRGEIPLWNPLSDCGVPFLAQWNTLVLYPLSIIYILFEPSWSVSVFCLVHLFLGGLGSYLLARQWTGNSLASALAGLTFAFGGVSISSLQWTSQLAAQMWMPWVIWAVERAWKNGRRDLVWGALVGALQMLSGAPETILLTWLIAFALWGAEWWTSNQRAKMMGRFFTVVALVAGLAAAQLLPFLELVRESQRGIGFADTRWSMPGWGWANLLVPLFHGQIGSQGIFIQHQQAWISSYYLGIGTLLLGILAILLRRDRRAIVLALCGLVGLILAAGENTVIYRGLREAFPLMSLMTFPIKYVLATALVGPLLAAFGMTALLSVEARSASRYLAGVGIAVGLGIGVIAWFAWRFPLPHDDWPVTLRNALERLGILIGVTGLLLMLLRAVDFRKNLVVAGLLLLVMVADLMTHVPQRNITVPRWVYEPGLMRTKLAMDPQPGLGSSRAMLTPYAEVNFLNFVVSKPADNFLGKRLGYFANCNLLDSVPKVDGFFPLSPRKFDDINTLIFTNHLMAPLMDFLSVSQITAPGRIFDWVSRPTFLPLVTAGQKPVFVSPDASLEAMSAADWKPQEVVFLDEADHKEVQVRQKAAIRILSTRFGTHRIGIETEAAEPGLVVVSQTFYRHWKAYVNGRKTGLLRANHAFQAIQVPAGRSRVELVYEDTTFHAGVLVSILSVFGAIWLWLRSRQTAEK